MTAYKPQVFELNEAVEELTHKIIILKNKIEDGKSKMRDAEYFISKLNMKIEELKIPIVDDEIISDEEIISDSRKRKCI